MVALHGTLSRKTFAGPPNYEDVRKGDKAETFWFLSLVSPICMNEDKSEPDLDPSRENIRKVQLVLVEVGAYDRVKALVGKKVVATGTLIGGISAHHHTPVLLTIKSIHVGR